VNELEDLRGELSALRGAFNRLLLQRNAENDVCLEVALRERDDLQEEVMTLREILESKQEKREQETREYHVRIKNLHEEMEELREELRGGEQGTLRAAYNSLLLNRSKELARLHQQVATMTKTIKAYRSRNARLIFETAEEVNRLKEELKKEKKSKMVVIDTTGRTVPGEIDTTTGHARIDTITKTS
jgi:chromosome segregation ATPase